MKLILLILLTLLFAGCSQEPLIKNDMEDIIFEKDLIPQGTSEFFDYNGKEAILINHEGKFYAFYKNCPVHPNLDVEYRYGKLICPHGEFSVDGIATKGLPERVSEDLKRIDLIVDGNEVIVR